MKLSLEKPPIGAFTHQALLLAILTTNKETYSWIYSNYIQIYCVKDMFHSERGSSLDFFYNFYGDFHFFEHCTCSWLLMNRYPRDVVRDKWENELKFVKERINNNEYVFMVVDKKYYYNSDRSSFHPILIYGFDEDKKVINFIDNNQYGKYSFQEASFDNFMMSNNVPFEQDRGLPTGYGGRPEGLCAFKFRDVVCKDLTGLMIHKIIIDLQSYINPPILDNTEFCYGIYCIDEIIKYYDLVSIEKGYIDIRGLYALIDQKVLMTLRLEFMENNKYLSSGMATIYKEKVEIPIRNVLNLLIKYNITRDEENVKKGVKYLNNIKSHENILLNEVLSQLKNMCYSEKNDF